MTSDDPTHAVPPGGGHEPRDIRVRPVVLAGAALLLSVALTFVGMQALLVHYQAREASRSGGPSPLAQSYGLREPPAPRLQPDPLEDLRTLRAREEGLLHGYAWVDRSAGTVRIPIERAIDVLAARAAAGGR
jgi:hypothetical protein